jgi:uncharacterized membrane-anchored protein YhcB (DUF1043 family)
MTYEILFVGVGGAIIGTIIGAFISARLTYSFQKKLLEQQLDFQKQQAEADTILRKQIHDETIETIKSLRDTLNIKIGMVVTRLSALSNLNQSHE